MAFQTSEAELAKKIRAGNIEKVYYFYGKDTAAVQSFTERLVTKLVGKDETSLDLYKLDGRKLSVRELWECCNMLPCFSEKVVVTVNDPDCDSLSKDDMAYLKETIGDLPESTALIFYVTGIDIYKGRNNITAANNELKNACGKVGDVYEFAYKTPEELSKIIISRVKKLGGIINSENAAYLAEKCLCEQAAINSEMSKLAAYADGREITKDDIDLLCARRLEADVFKLAGLILKRNADAAFNMMSDLYDMQTPTQIIIATLARSFLDIYRAKAAMPAGKGVDDVAKDFEYAKNRSFVIKHAFNDCRGVSEQRIRRCITSIAKADMQSKQMRTDDRILLERCITEMLEK